MHFFCFIPPSLVAKIEFQYIEIGLFREKFFTHS